MLFVKAVNYCIIKSNSMKNIIPLFAFLFILAACGNEPSSNTSNESPAQEEVTASRKKYTLTPFNASPAFEDATIQSMTYSAGAFNFEITGESYKLGEQTPDAPQKMCANSAEGQHIHLIVDNQPYAAKYEASFNYEIENGEHYLLAFLSRSYHESIKTAGAYKAEKVMVENNSITATKPINQAMVFYSRPKGNYVGKAETEKVMLDYYLVNNDETGYVVEADINGEKHLLDQWQPYYIEGLPIGENTITLTLLDKKGEKVDAPLNPVTRTFTLVEDPAENL